MKIIILFGLIAMALAQTTKPVLTPLEKFIKNGQAYMLDLLRWFGVVGTGHDYGEL